MTGRPRRLRESWTLRATTGLLLVMLLAALLAVAPTSAQSDARPELRIRLQFASPGGIYDPARWRYTSDWFVYPNLFNWLVRWVPGTGGSRLEPDLAERWTASPDGLTFTFFLRRGVQFHKGFGELTADDVVFSIKRQEDETKMSFSRAFTDVAGVDALDRYTVRIRLKQPNAAFLPSVLAYRPGLIVSKRAVEQFGDDFAKNPIGTGPFMFERQVARDVVVVAHDQFFRGRPQVKRITFTHIPDEIVAATALIRGEYQVIWTRGNPEAFRMLQQATSGGVKVQRVVVYDSLRHIAPSPNFRPTQDVRVRRALSYAINRQQIAAALPGLELPTDVMRSNRLFGGSLDVPRYSYNPERAKQLLAEAGYANGFRVRIMYQTRSPEDILANIVQTSWRAVGIDTTLDPAEPTQAFDRRDRLDFDVTVTSVGRPADPDLFFSDLFWSAAGPPGGSNLMGYKAADDLILAGRRELDRARREVIYKKLHTKLMTDLPIIPLSFQIFAAAWRSPVSSMISGTNNEFWGETIKTQP